MNWKIFSIEVFAVMASYLILSLPVAGATQVNITYHGMTSDFLEWDYSSVVSKAVSVNNPGSSATVSVSVENATGSVSILEAHVYRCRGSDPSTCIGSTAPVSYEGPFSSEYGWSDIRDTGTGYPQTANVLTLVRVKSGGSVFWLGYWDIVTRSGDAAFSVDSREIDEIEVKAKASQYLGSIKYFVQNLFMIPMNAKWISGVVFKTATELHALKSSEMPSLEGDVVSGSEIVSAETAHTFVLPQGTSGTMGSATLNLNPDYTCGNGNCEASLGEGQSVCCYDCGCPTGYYCDAEMLCKSESAISMSLHGSPDTRVTNCNEDHVIYIPVKVTNLPGDACVKSASYSLAGDVYPVQCNKGSGGVFSCPVNVPAVEECNTGEYWVSPNSITLTIEYSDGDAKKMKTMTVSFPDITIGSFECGNDACESSLGESQANCCLDCGCAAGKYCDWGGPGSVPSDAKCKTPLANSDLYMGSINPAHFSDQPLTGNSAKVVIKIKNKPLDLVIESLECSMDCAGDEGACESTCSVGGCVPDSSDPDVYSAECDLNFFITDYNALSDYDLSPVFTADVRYYNNSGIIRQTLTSAFPIISIGAHWCGDRVCGSDESSYTCCYDCGCPAGEYCDTRSLSGPSSGDGCKPREFELSVNPVGDSYFQDSSVSHDILIGGKIPKYPSGTMLTGSCEIQGGEFDCGIVCLRENSAVPDEYNFTCMMTIPPVDYIGSPYYEPAKREIFLNQNSFVLRHTYNNGSDNVTDSRSFSAGEITLNVTSHCGEGGCEGNLGEGQATCCRDCGCSDYGEDYFCYTGQSPSGVCLPNSSILLEITGFEPDPTDCTIYKEGEECVVTLNTFVNVHVINPPADIDILESYYTAGQQEDTEVTCYKTLNKSSYVCPISLENIPGAAEEGTENINVNIKMTIGYTISNMRVTQNIEGTSSLAIEKSYSAAVMSCQSMMESIDNQMGALQKSKQSSNIWMIILLVLGVVSLALFILCTTETWGVGNIIEACEIWLMIALALFSAAMSMMSKIQGQDDQIMALEAQKAEKQAMCDAQTTADLAQAEASGLTPIPSI